MKTRNLFCLVALCAGVAVGVPANAQDVFVDDATTITEFTCDNTTRYFSNWRNNWFIEVEAGINQPFVERGDVHSGHAVDHKKMTLTYGLGFGRWYLPILDFVLRLSVAPCTGILPWLLILKTDGHVQNM